MKTIFTTYQIKIKNNNDYEQVLSRFNGREDLLDILQNYCNYLLTNVRHYTDTLGKHRTFTLNAPPQLNSLERTIHGDFDSAYTGELLKIKAPNNGLLFDVEQTHLQSRSTFFLFSIPKKSTKGYLVVESKRNHSVKVAIENSLNEYLKFLGYSDYRISILPLTNQRRLIKIIEKGQLKEINLVKFGIGSSEIESFGGTRRLTNGLYKRSLKFNKNSETTFYKEKLKSLFLEKRNDYDKITINGLAEEFDEVSFRIIYNGNSKTFYIKNKAKIRSNIDVSHLLIYSNGIATIKSKLYVALELIQNRSDRENKAIAA